MNPSAKSHDVVIREAVVTDVPAIQALIRELAEFEKLADQVVATEETLRETLFGQSPVAFCLLAEVEGKAAGFALFFYNYSTFLSKNGLYLEDLFVRPEYRGKGIGKLLFQALAKKAVEKKCGRMEWSVLKWNEPAIQFSENLNATRMEDWVVYRLTGDPLKKLAH
jgi:GNAT superfamily N-acetyltransferase